MAKKRGTEEADRKVEPNGQAHVHSSFNNIIISLTNNSVRLFHGRQP
jgi:small subunit ribosomal protein S11